MERLVRLGSDTRVLDNFSSGKKENLAGVIDDVEVVYGDVRDVKAVAKAVEGVDAVIHLAALIDVNESLEKPLLYHDVNSTGTLNLLTAAKSSRKFVFISSCAVYGNPVRLPVGEDHPINPLSPYAASKLSAEAYCGVYSENFDSKAIIFRLFNVYGPKQGGNQYSGVINIFMKRARSGEPMVIFGDGAQTRDFVFVDDVVELIVRAVKSDASGVFNVGTGNAVSINQLAEIVPRTLGCEQLKPVHTDARPGDVLYSRADTSKIDETFGFRPHISLEEGLRRLVVANN